MTENKEDLVFDHKDYKSYLKAWLKRQPNRGHGEKKRIAEKLRCHNTYVTQVLEGPAHLSLEQADLLNAYLGHSREEAKFFLLLVQHNRAGSASLRKHFADEVAAVLEQRHVLGERLEFEKTLSESDQARYYSVWYYAAIHLIVGLAPFGSASAIATALSLDLKLVQDVLEFLLSKGFVAKEAGRYTVGPTSIHLGKDSPMLLRHHGNWRLKAMQALEKDAQRGLHYSSVVTLARSDIPRVKEIMIQAIEQIRAIVRPSANEELCCYTMDFFEL